MLRHQVSYTIFTQRPLLSYAKSYCISFHTFQEIAIVPLCSLSPPVLPALVCKWLLDIRWLVRCRKNRVCKSSCRNAFAMLMLWRLLGTASAVGRKGRCSWLSVGLVLPALSWCLLLHSCYCSRYFLYNHSSHGLCNRLQCFILWRFCVYLCKHFRIVLICIFVVLFSYEVL